MANRARGLSIAWKLRIALVGLGLSSAVIVGVLSYQSARSIVAKEVELLLTSALEARSLELSQYLGGILQDLNIQAASLLTEEAILSFDAAYASLDDPIATLQAAYIENNPHPTGEKEKLDRGDSGTAYDGLHGRYHPTFRKLQSERDYYDVFLFNTGGDLIYSVFKALDFATNMRDGPWRDTDLANAFREAMAVTVPDTPAFFDFRPYAPSADAPASFIAEPVLDAAGQPQGVVAFQMPVSQIKKLMSADAGLGETGQTYLVGPDGTMRSDDKFTEVNDILARTVDSEAVRRGLNGESGLIVAPGLSGAESYIAFKPFAFLGTQWVIVAEQTRAEAEAPLSELALNATLVTLLCAATLMIAGIFLGRFFTTPLSGMAEAMASIADGRLDTEIPALDRTDELGDMAAAVQVFRDNGRAVEQLRQEQEAARAQAGKERREALQSMAQTIESETASAVQAVLNQTQSMSGAARHMVESADKVSANANGVAAAAEQSLNNAQTVASAAEELSASIEEILRQVGRQNEISEQAATQASQSSATLNDLSAGAAKIGDVVGLIRDVAEQTNLLALNATIEAARAGDAGKGFAVVAGEVKQLATQTANATDRIAEQVGAMQQVTADSTQAIGGIVKTIHQMNEIAGTIADAMREQSAATREITGNISQTTSASSEVTQRIGEVSTEAKQSERLSTEVSGLSAEVSALVEDLRGNLVRIVRSSTTDVDRRETPRQTVEHAAVLRLGPDTATVTVCSLSAGGARVVPGLDTGEGMRGTLALTGVSTTLEVETVAAAEGEMRLRFVDTNAAAPALAALLDVSATS